MKKIIFSVVLVTLVSACSNSGMGGSIGAGGGSNGVGAGISLGTGFSF